LPLAAARAILPMASMRQPDRRQALSITELSEADIAAIATARIPEDKSDRTDDLR
jgi:hypothetical protein